MRYRFRRVLRLARLQAVAALTRKDTAPTHLRRLGVNPVTVARLQGYADADDMTLSELVRYILSDYMPGYMAEPSESANVVRLPDHGRE